jgi:hypothetical protein
MSETYLGAFGLKAAPFSKEIRRRRPLATDLEGYEWDSKAPSRSSSWASLS